MSSNLKIKINGTVVAVPSLELTLIQECERAGVYIPRFCYHDRLSIAGNCRMCLVELEHSVKPVIACSTALTSNMSVFTNSNFVKKLRENILEFLLINHPLDCPICDQGGECDLQDQSMVFGSDRGRFKEIKRSVEDKDFGPFIKTIMTRCIHCTRCVRFFDEVAGNPLLGTMGRGRETEISTYLHAHLDNELSGNVIDLCPVGALTSKPYAFTSRPWELSSIESIDIFDSMGSNVRYDIKGNIIMRVLPKLNELINEEWITNTARFSYDGFRKQRLMIPMRRVNTSSGVLFSYYSWEYLLVEVVSRMLCGKYNVHVYGGELLDLFSVFLLKYLIDSFHMDISFHLDNIYDTSRQSNYLMSESLVGLSNYNSFLILGLDLKKELSLLNSRIKKLKWKYPNKVNIFYIGPKVSFNYTYKHIGLGIKTVLDIICGKNALCSLLLNNATCVLQNHVYNKLTLNLSAINKDIITNNIVSNISDIHYASLGFKINGINNSVNNNDFIYLLNYNKWLPSLQSRDIKNTFVVYHGHHGSFNSMNSDVLLPSYTHVEDTGLFLNLEGRIQASNQVIYGPATSRSFSSVLVFLISQPFTQYSYNQSYINDLFKLFISPNYCIDFSQSFFMGNIKCNKYISSINFSTLKYNKVEDNIISNNSMVNYNKIKIQPYI